MRRPRSAATRAVLRAPSESWGSTAPRSRCFRTRSVTTSIWCWDGTETVSHVATRIALGSSSACARPTSCTSTSESRSSPSPRESRADRVYRPLGRAPRPAAARIGSARRIVVTFQGDDARQAKVGGRLVEAVPERYTPELDAVRRRTIAAFDRYAHAIFFLNPDLADVLPERASFLPYASVDPDEWTVSPEEPAGPPLVVHAPPTLGSRAQSTSSLRSRG